MAKIHAKTNVRSRQRVGKIAAAVHNGSSLLTQNLSRRVGKEGWQVSPACVEEINQSLLRVLQARERKLADAIHARQTAVDRGKDFRSRRDEASREVYGLLVRLRKILDGAAGPKAVRASFGRGKTPREPREVWRVAGNLKKRIGNEKSRRSMCGRIGSEEVFLHWLEELREPLERLDYFIRCVDQTETEERRTVPAVQRAKAEMQEAQKHAYQVLEGLYGLAGLEDMGRGLRVREASTSETKARTQGGAEAEVRTTSTSQAVATQTSRSSRPVDAGGARIALTDSPIQDESGRTTGTTASAPAGSRRTGRTTSTVPPETRRSTRNPEVAAHGSAPTNRTGRAGELSSARSTQTTGAGPSGSPRTSETREEKAVSRSGRIVDGTAHPVDWRKRPADAALHQVRNDSKLLSGIPHHWEDGEKGTQIAPPREDAA